MSDTTRRCDACGIEVRDVVIPEHLLPAGAPSGSTGSIETITGAWHNASACGRMQQKWRRANAVRRRRGMPEISPKRTR